MKVKNSLYAFLPQVTVTKEISGTIYRFNGVYAGYKSLPSKLLKLMDKNSENGGDKT